MIRCIPRGICSWDFLLDGEGHQATLELNWLSEQGAVTVDGVSFDIQKHGVLSGHWTLRHDGMEVVSAQKSNAFTRTFCIQDPSDNLVLCAESALGRCFRLARSGEVIATIYPDHAFTRRATIKILTERWDFPTIAFAFWLVVLTWRRAASNSGGG